MHKTSRYWTDEDARRLRMMAKAGWSIQMAAKQLERLPWEVETRAEVQGLQLGDRTASACAKCDRPATEACPYHVNFCTRTVPFKAEA